MKLCNAYIQTGARRCMCLADTGGHGADVATGTGWDPGGDAARGKVGFTIHKSRHIGFAVKFVLADEVSERANDLPEGCSDKTASRPACTSGRSCIRPSTVR